MMARALLLTLLLGSCAETSSKEESTAQVSAPLSTDTPSLTAQEDAAPLLEPQAEHTPKAVAKVRIETIQFPATDGLLVTADLYQWHEEDAPFIVLFHQAGWSRGEYKEIAPKLGELGFNCLAVDQRSGKSVNKTVNETAKLARTKKLPTAFLDALPDMRAALTMVKTRYPDAKRVAWGSSYSSALVLVLAGQEPELIDAVLSFSPGEYFARFGKSKVFVQEAASKIKQPAFLTSAKSEHKNWKSIYQAIASENKIGFLPKTAGNHGARALWVKQSDSAAYWSAVTAFLGSL